MSRFTNKTEFEDLEDFLNEAGFSADRDHTYSVWRDQGNCYTFHHSCAGKGDLVDFCNRLRDGGDNDTETALGL